jgi:phosphoribosylanthranilate isomerase
LKIKICGIANINDAKLCADLEADAIGFIFYEKSKRYVEPGIVKNIVSELPAFLFKVGVFVNEDPRIVNSIAKKTNLNLVQLHGEESPSYLSEIEFPVIKSFRVDEDFDYKILTQYENCSFLLDSFHAKQYGGTGLKFDWTKIPNQVKNKIILAGGISTENIESIYNEIGPYAIDISSSVETEPGKKDHIKLNELFAKYNELRKI